ncbi:hypothetical protein GCM10022247_29940 [Allokutzneria multivorans]|uniref:Cytochrome P450 n=1 Tax=Allokutzneria multivorans TaxID=1142134 RepID=A0ABP7S3T6_9PSEU
MLHRHPSLWSYILEWDALAAKGKKWTWLNDREVVLLDPELILDVLNDRTGRYEDQSAFFRTSSRAPLCPRLRRQMSGSLMRVLSANKLCPSRTVPALVGSAHRVPGLGVRLVSMMFTEELGLNLNGAGEIVDEYLRKIIVEHDLLGTRLVRVNRLFTGLVSRLADWLKFEYQAQDPPRNIFDVALSGLPELDHTEAAELALRLALSVTGFTGVALEWALVHGSEDVEHKNALSRFGAHNVLRESQRLLPTAWRLVRRASTDHSYGDLRIPAGTTVILSTATGQRNESEWSNGSSLCPSRWNESAPANFYIPFGQGANSCPAKILAPRIISETVLAISKKATVSFASRQPRKPTVGSLLGLPRGRITFHVRATRAER